VAEGARHGRKLRVHVYSVAALPIYYQPLAELYRSGQLDAYGLHWLRLVQPLAKNALKRLGLLRSRQVEPLGLGEAVDRIVGLRHLARSDAVVIMLEPYDSRVAFLLPIKEALRRRGVQVVYYTSWHDWDSGWQPRTPLPGVLPLWRRFLRDLDAVCVTQAAADALRSRTRRATVIPHPVDLERFSPAPSEPSVEAGLHWITVARLVEGKGLRALIRIFRARAAAGATLTIVGDGPLRAELTALASDAPVSVLPFDAAALPDLLRRHHAFVLNSHRHGRWEELFGMVIVEAMACGLPVVATDCIGPRAIITSGEDGLLVPQRDDAALEAALRALEDDPAHRRGLARCGLERARERYALDRIAARWLEVLSRSPGTDPAG